jgi:hypothetical protein
MSKPEIMKQIEERMAKLYEEVALIQILINAVAKDEKTQAEIESALKQEKTDESKNGN